MNKQDELKAQEIIGCNRENCLECGGTLSVKEGCVQFRRIMQMAAWKEEQMIQKACEWLLHNAIGLDDGEFPVYDIDFIEDFKQAMKGE